jgi:hypothetical protein
VELRIYFVIACTKYGWERFKSIMQTDKVITALDEDKRPISLYSINSREVFTMFRKSLVLEFRARRLLRGFSIKDVMLFEVYLKRRLAMTSIVLMEALKVKQ